MLGRQQKKRERSTVEEAPVRLLFVFPIGRRSTADFLHSGRRKLSSPTKDAREEPKEEQKKKRKPRFANFHRVRVGWS